MFANRFLTLSGKGASLAFQQTLLNAGSEVNDALTAWQTSISKSELLDKQVASLQTAARSTSLLMVTSSMVH